MCHPIYLQAGTPVTTSLLKLKTVELRRWEVKEKFKKESLKSFQRLKSGLSERPSSKTFLLAEGYPGPSHVWQALSLRTVSGGRNHLARAFCMLKGDCVDGLSLKFVRPQMGCTASSLHPRESRAIRYHVFLLHKSLTWSRHFRQVKTHSFLPNIHSALISGWL